MHIKTFWVFTLTLSSILQDGWATRAAVCFLLTASNPRLNRNNCSFCDENHNTKPRNRQDRPGYQELTVAFPKQCFWVHLFILTETSPGDTLILHTSPRKSPWKLTAFPFPAAQELHWLWEAEVTAMSLLLGLILGLLAWRIPLLLLPQNLTLWLCSGVPDTILVLCFWGQHCKTIP